MSLGSDKNPLPLLLLMLGGYLLFAGVVAVVTNRVYNTRTGVAFLINLAPLTIMVVLAVGWRGYRDYAWDRRRTVSFQNAIADAPAIYLGEPFVKMVERPVGGVVLLVHVPFTVDRTIHAHSLNILVVPLHPGREIQYSAKRECNYASEEPSNTYYVVDREHAEPTRPGEYPGIRTELDPGKQYYLFKELHIARSECALSDFQDFDPKQLSVTIDTAPLKQELEKTRR